MGCFGNTFQLYCSKGILNTSFPGSELIVPLSKCRSIQLDKWRLAPRVSLRSIASDSAVTECCDCSFPKSSECTVILSSSEDEDKGVGRGIWVKNELYSLTHDDREMVASPKWLTDKIIMAAQMLILQHFPTMSGLQPPPLQEVLALKVYSGEFIQIVNIRNNHWCVVSTVGCENGVVNVYDSMYPSIPMKTITLIASMVSNSVSKLVVRMMDVDKQSNGADCGVLAWVCNTLLSTHVLTHLSSWMLFFGKISSEGAVIHICISRSDPPLFILHMRSGDQCERCWVQKVKI